MDSLDHRRQPSVEAMRLLSSGLPREELERRLPAIWYQIPVKRLVLGTLDFQVEDTSYSMDILTERRQIARYEKDPNAPKKPKYESPYDDDLSDEDSDSDSDSDSEDEEQNVEEEEVYDFGLRTTYREMKREVLNKNNSDASAQLQKYHFMIFRRPTVNCLYVNTLQVTSKNLKTGVEALKELPFDGTTFAEYIRNEIKEALEFRNEVDTLVIKTIGLCYHCGRFDIKKLDLIGISMDEIDIVTDAIGHYSYPLKAIIIDSKYSEAIPKDGKGGLKHEIFNKCEELHLVSNPTHFLKLTHPKVVFLKNIDLSDVVTFLEVWRKYNRKFGTCFTFQVSSTKEVADIYKKLLKEPGATLREIASRKRFRVPHQVLVPLDDSKEVKFFCKYREKSRKIQTFKMKVQRRADAF